MKKATKKLNVQSIGLWLSKYSYCVALAFIITLMASSLVFATGGVNTMWNELMDLIKTWVVRLGLVVVLIGGIMFGLGFKNDDAEQKSRGITTAVAGGIVTAVAGLVSYVLIP